VDARRAEIFRAQGKGSDYATLREEGSSTVATVHPGLAGRLAPWPHAARGLRAGSQSCHEAV